ncbi:SAM-dependent methyltransferase [Thermodesulfobacteriota bacterium]
MSQKMKSFAFPTTGSPRHATLIFATSASALAYEILLMRLFSIGQWHHYAYMIISMALLGFGISGSLLFLTIHRVRSHRDGWLVGLAALTAVAFPFAYSLSQIVPLDPLQLVWQPGQWWLMLLTYLLMALPFVLAGSIIGIILAEAGEYTHRMYASDLLGAGCGVLALVPALYLTPPWKILPAIGTIVLCGAIGCCFRMRRKVMGFFVLIMAFCSMLFLYRALPPLPRIHDTKMLPITLTFPDARIEHEKTGPQGLIQVVGSSLIRHAPGLSLNFAADRKDQKASLPEQKAIFVDADALSPITRFTGDLDELAYLDFMSGALPYHVRRPTKVLVMGSGGGTDILLALKHGISDIVALEANGQVLDLLVGPYAAFSGHLFRRPVIRPVVQEARQFLYATDETFDLIQLSLIDSFVSSAGGLHSAGESYLYTTEAMETYLSRLTDTGMIAITRWLKLPPRDSLRVMATALSALRRMKIAEAPQDHLLFIRSWNTTTILISKRPFTAEEIVNAGRFCDSRSFDLAYYAGMELKEANRFDIQEFPYYFNGSKALCGPAAESFLQDYIFDVSAPTDDRPYFSHFFRWDKAGEWFKHLKREWFPLIELGYVFILATLIQAVFAAVVLILFPLLSIKHVRGTHLSVRPKITDLLLTVAYFGSIGFGFMFIEMALIPKFTLLLSHPVYSAAVVLSAMLVFAGLGSSCLGRVRQKNRLYLWLPVIVLTLWVAGNILAGDRLFASVMGWSFLGRLCAAVGLLSVPSFFLGWPFPAGLNAWSARFPQLIPWAWGINGCASVIGAVLAKCLAIGIGFQQLMLAGCVLYFIAVSIFYAGFRER